MGGMNPNYPFNQESQWFLEPFCRSLDTSKSKKGWEWILGFPIFAANTSGKRIENGFQLPRQCFLTSKYHFNNFTYINLFNPLNNRMWSPSVRHYLAFTLYCSLQQLNEISKVTACIWWSANPVSLTFESVPLIPMRYCLSVTLCAKKLQQQEKHASTKGHTDTNLSNSTECWLLWRGHFISRHSQLFKFLGI